MTRILNHPNVFDMDERVPSKRHQNDDLNAYSGNESFQLGQPFGYF
ncbi:MAG: hypothetical protein ACRCST_14985 [Turicibacter sp.]